MDGTNKCTVLISVRVKKVGTTTVSYKVNGVPFKFKVKAYKYTNPFKTLKFGSKNYAKSFEKTSSKDVKVTSNKKYKVNIKLNSNFKKLKITYFNPTTGKETTVKNGKTIKVKKYGSLWISVYNKKAKTYEEAYMSFY